MAESAPGDPTRDVSAETLLNLERLAYLRLTPEERAGLVGDLVKILQAARSLTVLDLGAFEPLTQAIEQVNVMRSDEIEPSWPLDQALANAPQSVGPYIQVPRVLE
jgi:aspartyl-tRNA(Asn)/glutamyl-tRNA(Gln) amidotransferase subunit C